MMTPAKISEMTLDALRAARDTLDSTEWALEMDAAPADTRRESGLLLGRVQGEILRLENLQLEAVAESLAANGVALAAASADVKREVKKIAKVARILKTVDQLVMLAIKVVPKAMGLMGASRRVAGKPKPKPKAKQKQKPRPKARAKPKATRAAKPRRKTGPSRRAR